MSNPSSSTGYPLKQDVIITAIIANATKIEYLKFFISYILYYIITKDHSVSTSGYGYVLR